MSMKTHAFDAQVRVLECRNCGAPATMQLTQGQFECSYCNAINVYTQPAAPAAPEAKPQEEKPRVSVDPRALAAIEATLVDPQHVAWVRNEAAQASGPAELDVAANPPPDLRDFSQAVSWTTWKSQRIPALRQSWQEVLPRADQGPLDARSQHRVYWLALRLNDGYSITASMAHDSKAKEEEMLKRRAVLETALQHLEATAYGSVLRCRLSRAACHVGDLESARAWLASCPAKPASVEVDAEMRIALSTLEARQNDPNAILALLEPGGTPIPLRIGELEVVGVTYRVHAHETIGSLAESVRVLREGCARFETARIRGQLSLEQVAPKARARLWRVVWVKAIIVLAVIVALMVLLFR